MNLSQILGRKSKRISNFAWRTIQASSSQRTEVKVSSPQSHYETDTIFALSSGPLVKCGVAVVRLSGPSCGDALQELLKHSGDSSQPQSVPAPRQASVRRLYCPESGDELDRALVLWMPGPASFTGEDVCELHLHGGRAVVQGVLNALSMLDNRREGCGIRAAERGEFTKRAFDNGKMDLTEVEGLADLLAAETSVQRKQALRQMDGHLRKQFELWRETLIKCLAHTEAVIDFGDDDREDDVDDGVMNLLIPIVQSLRSDIEKHLSDGGKGELVREGIRIALVGPPNAGKSSLLNVLARRPAAIVSPIAGTTRDIIEVRLELGGVPCVVSDTAGFRAATDDPVELEGIKRAHEALQSAHIKVFLSDQSDETSVQLSQEMLQKHEVISTDQSLVVIVRNKADLQSSTGSLPMDGTPFYDISCVTGSGINALEEGLNSMISDMLNSANPGGTFESTLITRARHRRHLQICASHLDTFLNEDLLMDAAAEELRLGTLELGRVTGRVDVEELLDVIFRDFCIGK